MKSIAETVFTFKFSHILLSENNEYSNPMSFQLVFP